jgi:hypothetical protein
VRVLDVAMWGPGYGDGSGLREHELPGRSEVDRAFARRLARGAKELVNGTTTLCELENEFEILMFRLREITVELEPKILR